MLHARPYDLFLFPIELVDSVIPVCPTSKIENVRTFCESPAGSIPGSVSPSEANRTCVNSTLFVVSEAFILYLHIE